MNSAVAWVLLAISHLVLPVSPASSPTEPRPPWVPEAAVRAAREGFISSLADMSQKFDKETFGISDTIEAQNCTIEHPYKFISIAFEKYQKGHDLLEYILPSPRAPQGDFGFEVYCGGKYAGGIRVAFSHGSWKAVSGWGNNGESIGPMDSIFARYRVSAGFTVCRDEETYACFAFKGDSLVAAYASDVTRFVPMDPNRYMEREHANALRWEREQLLHPGHVLGR